MENPFAVPPPLFSRKRRAATATIEKNNEKIAPFMCEETYHAYAIDGHMRESMVFERELDRRMAIRALQSYKKQMTTQATTVATSGSIVANIQSMAATMHSALVSPPVATAPIKHLALVVWERAEKEHSKEIAQAMNIGRRLSSLGVAEHIEYMQLRQKRTRVKASGMHLVLALTSKEVKVWDRLDAKAKAEQAEFVADLGRLAKREKLHQYMFVPQYVDQLFHSYLQNCRNQVMHLYPRYYETQLTVRLHGSTASASEQSASVMNHIREVMSQGPHTMLDTEKLKGNLTIDSKMVEEVGSADHTHCRSAWSVISADPTAEKLMELHECDVAMTSSTLLAIFDTAADEDMSESQGWIIPVKNRVCMVKGTPRRQVYLDRPFINAEVSAREKIQTMVQPLAVAALANSNVPQRERVSYHVWKVSELKVLIRCKIRMFMDNSLAKTATPVSVFVKADHKPLGIEERLTDSEFRRMWLHSWIRGGSTLVLGRISPQTSEITSWSKYQLSGFSQSLGSPGFPEIFEPLDFFLVVNTVLTSLQSLPPANFLLKTDFRPQRKHQGLDLQILRSATQLGLDETHEHQFDLFQHINTCGETSSDVLGYVVPSWPPVPFRIPYSYRTASHCPEFLQHSTCEKEGSGGQCELIHLRLMFTKRAIKWTFEDYSATPAARRANYKRDSAKKYPILQPKFPFCHGTKDLQGSKLLLNASSPIRCEDPSTCKLPHMSLHAIAEQVADTTVRETREKRRKHKAANRARP